MSSKNGKNQETQTPVVAKQEPAEVWMPAIDPGQFYQTLARRPMIDTEAGPKREQKAAREFLEETGAKSNSITMWSWRNDWVRNTRDNFKHFGRFNRDRNSFCFKDELKGKELIIVGAGSSLERNIEYLRLAKQQGIAIMATSHAFMYLSHPDINIKPDYVVLLDAGGQWTEYIDTFMDVSDVPLFAEQGADTAQIKLWKGPVYFYRSVYPKSEIGDMLNKELDNIVHKDQTSQGVTTGGHITCAATSIAISVLGATTVIFAGTDYAFSHESEGEKFYPFQKTKREYRIDKPSTPKVHGMLTDIFGRSVKTNMSYLAFKNVMDEAIKHSVIHYAAQGNPLKFVNASEGGTLGAFPYGNSKYMSFMRLEDVIWRIAGLRKIPKEEDE